MQAASTDFRLARHAQAAFADDVLLNLTGAAADDQAQIKHVPELPAAVVAQMRIAAISSAAFAHRVDGQRLQFVAQLRALEFDDHGGQLGILAG